MHSCCAAPSRSLSISGPDTLNLDESLIENAITPHTRAICVVHYAGVSADVEAIGEIAARHGLRVVEDAALAICARRKGRSLGSFGQLAAFSFHATKPLTSGEGGALDRQRSDNGWDAQK